MDGLAAVGMFSSIEVVDRVEVMVRMVGIVSSGEKAMVWWCISQLMSLGTFIPRNHPSVATKKW